VVVYPEQLIRFQVNNKLLGCFLLDLKTLPIIVNRIVVVIAPSEESPYILPSLYECRVVLPILLKELSNLNKVCFVQVFYLQ
jgi:hypothetical protein